MTAYVSDLDGTLLHPSGTLTERARAAILAVLDAGVPFTVASARSATSIRGVLGDLPLRLPIICFNGGFISDMATGRHLHVFDIDAETAHTIHQRARDAGLSPIVSTTASEDRVYIRRPYANAGIQMYAEGRIRVADPRLRFVDDTRRGLQERVTCITLIGQRARLEPLHDWLCAALGDRAQPHLFDDIYTVGWSWITIHSPLAQKERAFGVVREEFGLADRPWVAFGDQENDLSMIRAADHGVAVANAVPAVLAVADEIIGPNHDDSVASYLLGRLRG